MQPLIQLVAADARQVVAAIVEEQVLQHRGRVVPRRRIARAQAAIELDQRLIALLRRLLLHRRLDVTAILVGIDIGEGSRSSSSVSMPMARSRIVTGILRLRSTLTEMTSRLDVSNSSQAPRFGINLAVETQLAGRRIVRAFEIDARRTHEL